MRKKLDKNSAVDSFLRAILDKKLAQSPPPKPGTPMYERLKKLQKEEEEIKAKGGEKLTIDMNNPHNRFIAFLSGYDPNEPR